MSQRQAGAGGAGFAGALAGAGAGGGALSAGAAIMRCRFNVPSRARRMFTAPPRTSIAPTVARRPTASTSTPVMRRTGRTTAVSRRPRSTSVSASIDTFPPVSRIFRSVGPSDNS